MSSTPAAPGSCCCSTRRCTWSTASRARAGRGRRRRRRPQLDGRASHAAATVSTSATCATRSCTSSSCADERIERVQGRRGARSATRSSWSAATASWNCHVHTNDIGAAIEAALDLGGRPQQDPRHRPLRGGRRGARVREAADRTARADARRDRLPAVTCAVVAVASGDGLAELFGQLGVQGVVTGGQTLNPSTAELLDAVEAVNADAGRAPAEQQEHHPRRRAGRCAHHQAVGSCRRVDAGGARRAVVYDPEARRDDNAAAMAEAAEPVATGEVTQAVRDTASDAGPDHRRSTGSASCAATASSPSPTRSTAAAMPCSIISSTHEREIVTVIEGERRRRRHTDALRQWVAEHRPDVHGRGAPRRPAAVPVPVRRRVSVTEPTHASRARRDSGRRLKGVGERSSSRCTTSVSTTCSTC